MSGFAQIGLSSRSAPCAAEPRPKSRGNIKNLKYHIFTIASLAKRRAIRGAGFILPPLDPRNKAKIGWRHAKPVRDRRPDEKIRLQTVPADGDGAKPCRTTRRANWFIRTWAPIPKSATNHLSLETGQERFSLETGQERYCGSRLESLLGPNPGRLNRASHRPVRRDRPCG
jgi:hypothetical protein